MSRKHANDPNTCKRKRSSTDKWRRDKKSNVYEWSSLRDSSVEHCPPGKHIIKLADKIFLSASRNVSVRGFQNVQSSSTRLRVLRYFYQRFLPVQIYVSRFSLFNDCFNTGFPAVFADVHKTGKRVTIWGSSVFVKNMKHLVISPLLPYLFYFLITPLDLYVFNLRVRRVDRILS